LIEPASASPGARQLTALGTMRTHLKRVLSKTGMARQAELAALLAGAAL
jgi:hypothetical protein